MKTIVVVNRHVIRENRKFVTRNPPFRISRGKYGKPTYSEEVLINGNARLIYKPDSPLPCGATVWLEIDE